MGLLQRCKKRSSARPFLSLGRVGLARDMQALEAPHPDGLHRPFQLRGYLWEHNRWASWPTACQEQPSKGKMDLWGCQYTVRVYRSQASPSVWRAPPPQATWRARVHEQTRCCWKKIWFGRPAIKIWYSWWYWWLMMEKIMRRPAICTHPSLTTDGRPPHRSTPMSSSIGPLSTFYEKSLSYLTPIMTGD